MTPPAGLRIAPATEQDVPTLLGLITALADYEKLAHLVVATTDGLRDALFGPRPAAEAMIATLDGRPVGYALWFQTFSTFLGRPGLYLEDLFVVPEARGAGVGRALLARLAALAVERGCGRVEWAVLDWNAPAIGFYRRLGAEPVDGWTIYRLTGAALDRLGTGEERGLRDAG